MREQILELACISKELRAISREQRLREQQGMVESVEMQQVALLLDEASKRLSTVAAPESSAC